MLEITTEAYQAKNGGIYINFGNKTIKLLKNEAEIIADSIPNIDRGAYKEFYSPNKE